MTHLCNAKKVRRTWLLQINKMFWGCSVLFVLICYVLTEVVSCLDSFACKSHSQAL